jgi:hypothetical protein
MLYKQKWEALPTIKKESDFKYGHCFQFTESALQKITCWNTQNLMNRLGGVCGSVYKISTVFFNTETGLCYNQKVHGTGMIIAQFRYRQQSSYTRLWNKALFFWRQIVCVMENATILFKYASTRTHTSRIDLSLQSLYVQDHHWRVFPLLPFRLHDRFRLIKCFISTTNKYFKVHF